MTNNTPINLQQKIAIKQKALIVKEQKLQESFDHFVQLIEPQNILKQASSQVMGSIFKSNNSSTTILAKALKLGGNFIVEKFIEKSKFPFIQALTKTFVTKTNL